MKHYPATEIAAADGLLTEEELVVELAARVSPPGLRRRKGDVKRVSRDVGISQSTLSNVLCGNRPIGRDVAEKLGYRKVVRFERIGP